MRLIDIQVKNAVIKFGELWNCCAEKPVKVGRFIGEPTKAIAPHYVFHALCTSCATQYAAENGSDWVADLPAKFAISYVFDFDTQHVFTDVVKMPTQIAAIHMLREIFTCPITVLRVENASTYNGHITETFV